MSTSQPLPSLHALRTAREQCSRFKAICQSAPSDWRFIARVERVNDQRLDLEGRIVEELASFYLAERTCR